MFLLWNSSFAGIKPVFQTDYSLLFHKIQNVPGEDHGAEWLFRTEKLSQAREIV